jgi:ABC-2 type transport system ATP-binding protein
MNRQDHSVKSALEITDLFKTYDDGTEALKGVSLQVQRGEFFGLLGPNGAGKSTIIGVLTSLVNKSSGHVSINGYDIDSQASLAKQSLGVVPQEFNFNIFESCLQIIVQQAGYYGISARSATPRAEELLKDLGLGDKINTPVRMLSGGMKRRLMIARSLVHEPSILLLDEPTAGVDISLRRQMWDFLTEENKNGLTIVLTTHNLEEAEILCKRIAIIDKGDVIALDETPKLLEQLQSEVVVLYTAGKVDELPDMPWPTTQVNAKELEVELGEETSISTVLAYLNTEGIEVQRMKNKSNRLEELFLRLVETP